MKMHMVRSCRGLTHMINFVLKLNKQDHREFLLSSFHLNGHTLGFHPQSQKLESLCTA